jgi:hypothetical protein
MAGDPLREARKSSRKNTMNNSLFRIAATVFLLLVSVPTVLAQSRAQEPPPGTERGRRMSTRRVPRPEPTSQFDLMSLEMRFDHRLVKGAPYSATAVTETVQVLADGTRITNKTTATIARDGEGRTRREQTLKIAGPFVVNGDSPRLVFINDVVAGVQYVLETRKQTARKQFSPRQPPGQPPSKPASGKTEALGKQAIEGIQAEGVRTTVMIPTGQIGNDRPIEIVSERWESPELQVVVLSKHKDPRLGETTYRLTNISRSEPAKSLFEVPGDYTVVEDRMSNRRGTPRMPRGRRPEGIRFE